MHFLHESHRMNAMKRRLRACVRSLGESAGEGGFEQERAGDLEPTERGQSPMSTATMLPEEHGDEQHRKTRHCGIEKACRRSRSTKILMRSSLVPRVLPNLRKVAVC